MRKKVGKACISFALFILVIALVTCVDLAPVGPANTSIGLSHLNKAVHDLIGVHMFWYQVTNLLGFWAILCGAVFACIGLKQLIERKSLKQVDAKILALGGLFVLLGVIYVLFEKVVVNCRPVLMEGETVPEASFPSSHTVLAFVIFGAIAMMLKDYLQDKRLVSMLQNACLVLILVSVIGRLISGVHWFTDILGGIFLSYALLMVFSGLLEKLDGKDPM
ncbi:MAG: phosphatase PAP2 family protein [Firmicutes bacterium]|nr:phosphatase PAP2 family protein [Bacillota bacterium]MBQ4409869.1 phosphatase PAP2 family protein [Bacillota bacterium]MBQ6295263.1 phosphatase PAP2 family protein [Bacillota bacterium]MBR0051466.1 phosphatase PAP2 family protein [Bacillota bacterium]MBR0210336.1 phosphatase PAP2 family protein [Bacillota bacterium]